MYYVYILSNWDDSVLYIGVTGNLPRRLVYYEHTNDVYSAISREKQLKKWRREKKNQLIEAMNPQWRDLSLDWD